MEPFTIMPIKLNLEEQLWKTEAKSGKTTAGLSIKSFIHPKIKLLSFGHNSFKKCFIKISLAISIKIYIFYFLKKSYPKHKSKQEKQA